MNVLGSSEELEGFDSMTVEEFLKAKTESIIARFTDETQVAADKLVAECQQKSDELREMLDSKFAVAPESTSTTNTLSGDNLSISNPESSQSVDQPVSTGPINLLLTVEEGLYKGKSFLVKPRIRRAARLIGRSSGKKFKEYGVSLSEDYEVSTSHAKLECKRAEDQDAEQYRILLTDMGSTNGTRVNNVNIEVDKPHRIKNGDTIGVGATLLRVKFEHEK
ncbi:unnamed protein product [marine sediment metagenome]|uniref:FHA domain-containing protein n=1 Tax=marine sediment metagenome TaxID=412755 RepID=X0V3D1_9ZZZZ